VLLSRAGTAAVGATLGAGVVVALPTGTCPLVEAAPVVRMLADASAGQCGPCVHGLRAVADRVGQLAAGRCPPEGLEQLERWRRLLPGRGACGHPDGVVRFVASLLSAFPTEVAMHQHDACGRRLRGVLPLEVG
jgi:NADH:ubiquinone oxidoreductase subunit F (NADH-binding)